MYAISRPLPHDVTALWHEIERYTNDMVDPPTSLGELTALWGVSWCIFTGVCAGGKTAAWFILTDPLYEGERWHSAGLTLVVCQGYRGAPALALSHLFTLQLKAWGFRRLWTNCKTRQAEKMARLCRFRFYRQVAGYRVYDLAVQEYQACLLTGQVRRA